MKLITLNVWGGKKEDLLRSFFSKYKDEVDILCLQEVSHDPQEENLAFSDNDPNFLANAASELESFDYHFHPSVGNYYGLATFVRQDFSVKETDDLLVSGEHGDKFDAKKDQDHARNIQYLKIEKPPTSFVIHNLHGMWTKKGKGDTANRIQQAKNVADHLHQFDKPQIICGDFNMRPDTKSMEIIESAGLRNLIKEFDVTTTRTSFYDGEEPFADYILVSDGVKVNNFEVLPDEVSDHAPLLLEFEL